jgi:hypothetical protein
VALQEAARDAGLLIGESDAKGECGGGDGWSEGTDAGLMDATPKGLRAELPPDRLGDAASATESSAAADM